MKDRTLCPCCEQYRRNFVEDFGLCPICGWEEDCVQEDDPDYTGGANFLSLNQSKEIWKQIGDRAEEGTSVRRFLAGLPLFDENGKVILEEPDTKEK